MIDRHATRGVYRRVTPAVSGWEDGRVDDIIPWLHQQLDNVEAKAKAATRGPWRVAKKTDYGTAIVEGPDALQDGGYDPATGGRRREMQPLEVILPDVDYGPVVALADAEHIAWNNPERVLRQVATDRRILAEYERLRLRDPLRVGPYWDGIRDAWETAVRMRAEAYDDQPGYQERWRLT